MLSLYWWRHRFGYKDTARFLLKNHFIPKGNVGDEMSPYLVSKLSGKDVYWSDAPHKILAIGTILGAVKEHDVIWGSGLGSATPDIQLAAIGDVEIRALRGYLSYDVLMGQGLACPAVFGDPALLLPNVYQSKIKKNGKIGIVTHHSQEKLNIRDSSLLHISPYFGVEKFIDSICACDYIVSSSLHGVITAEAYGVPVISMCLDQWPDNNNDFKFRDFYSASSNDCEFVFIKTTRSEVESDHVEFLNKASSILAKHKKKKPVFDANKLLESAPFEVII